MSHNQSPLTNNTNSQPYFAIAEGKTTKFVSEVELQQNKEARGVSREDGTFAGRTLTEAIMAQREEKERKFQEDWKIMKQGVHASSSNASHWCCILCDYHLLHHYHSRDARHVEMQGNIDHSKKMK